MNYIVSPHIDDAFLCLGGFFLNRFRYEPFKILHVFTRTNSTTRNNISGMVYEKDEQLVTALRKNEERKIAEITGHEYECWDFPDRPLRLSFTDNDLGIMEEQIARKIRSVVRKTDPVYFPLGIIHEDHLMMNRIGTRMMNDGYKVIYYEDMPYVVWDASGVEQRFTTLIEAGLTPVFEQIDIRDKIELVKHYGSQIRQDWLESLKAYAYNPRDNSYVERYWAPRQ